MKDALKMKLGLGVILSVALIAGYYGCGGGGSSGSSAPTAPAQVATPSPANNAINVVTNTQISWAAAGGATSYDVYFGATTTGWTAVLTNTALTSYTPANLARNTLYYWRIDAKNSAGATPGLNWEFTTT